MTITKTMNKHFNKKGDPITLTGVIFIIIFAVVVILAGITALILFIKFGIVMTDLIILNK